MDVLVRALTCGNGVSLSTAAYLGVSLRCYAKCYADPLTARSRDSAQARLPRRDRAPSSLVAKALRFRAVRVASVPSWTLGRQAPHMRRFLGLVLTLVLAGVVAIAIAAPDTIPGRTMGFTLLVALVFVDAAFIAGPWERVASVALFAGMLGGYVAAVGNPPEDAQEGAWTMGTGLLLGAMAGALLAITVNRLMTWRG